MFKTSEIIHETTLFTKTIHWKGTEINFSHAHIRASKNVAWNVTIWMKCEIVLSVKKKQKKKKKKQEKDHLVI